MAEPRVPSNVNKPTGGRPGDKRVIDQSAKLNKRQRQQSEKLKKAAASAASKVETGGD